MTLCDISCLNKTALRKHKLRWLKWIRLFNIEVHSSVRIVFDSFYVGVENKRIMHKWVSDGGIWCVMNYHYVITMWRDLWNEWDTQTQKETCKQQNSAIWRKCTTEIYRHEWGNTAISYLKDWVLKDFVSGWNQVNVCWLSGIIVRVSCNWSKFFPCSAVLSFPRTLLHLVDV